ncbi:MAG TPA: MFS transporter [Actinomycetota bacterium]|nr:MFS transporter [Actinomycetota bacterium]
MTRRLGSFQTVLADRNLRRVELAFLGFNMTESATWIAILVYAFERGGAAEMGAVSVILLVPSAIVAPFAAYAGDRFRRDRVLAIDYVVQGLAMGATAATLYADAPAGFVYAAATIASISITFTRPAQNSLLPALTPTPADLTAANVVSGVVEGAGKMLGPIIAGILLGTRDPRPSSGSSPSSRWSARCSWRGCAWTSGRSRLTRGSTPPMSSTRRSGGSTPSVAPPNLASSCSSCPPA